MQSVTDALGNNSITEYDVLNRVTQQTDALGNAVHYSYDNNGNLTSHTDPRGNVTNYAYNNLGKLTTRTDALNQAELTSYDLMGKVQSHTDRKGQVSGVTYDSLSRATRIGFGATASSPAAYTDTLDLTYDAVDRVTRIVDSKAGTITRQYDNFNRLTQETSPQGAITTSYDTVGRRISLTVTGQATVNYSYDNADRLTAITQGSQSVTFNYDAAGRRTQTTLANGLQVNYTYDVANQLTGIEYKKGASVIGNLTYSYDNAGRRTAMGGSLAQVDLPGAIATAIYDANNRLTNWNGQAFQYDLNGNLSNDGQKTYVWDSRNQLQGITGTTSALFNYDALGRRTSKNINGSQTSFLFDGDNFVQETKAGTKTNLLTGLGLDEVYNRGSEALLTDALGSIIGLTDAAGNLTTTYSYSPYGETTQSGTASTNSQQYTGRENDGTGLYYYRNRYYMPTCGRFVSEDPIGIAGGINLYQYAGGDPIGLNDPTGNCPQFPDGIDFVSVSWPVIIPGTGIAIPFVGYTLTIDRWGQKFFGPGIGIGKPAVGVLAGWYAQNMKNKEDSAAFQKGWSISLLAGMGTIINVPGGDSTPVIGTPGIGIGGSDMISSACK